MKLYRVPMACALRRALPTAALAVALGACGARSTVEDLADAAADAGPAEDAGDTLDAGAGPAADAGPTADAGSPDAGTPPTPRCEVTADTAACAHETHELPVGDRITRQVHFQTPAGLAPAAGWPVVVFFQGSFFSSGRTWAAEDGDAFGAFALVRTFAALLDAGYAIVAPEAHLDGNTFWDTNVPPFSIAWDRSPDHRLMLELFTAIEAGTFGDLDPARLYATGISSGGYMTSRMAVSYPGRFLALAVHSGAYATCSGALCRVPDELPADHPPTLFLHGEEDRIVPLRTAEAYAEALDDQGTETRMVLDSDAGHEWIEAAVTELPAWFDAYP